MTFSKWPSGIYLRMVNVVSLKLLYNDNKGCHSRENGNQAEKIGFPRIKYGAGLIKSGMTFCVKSFLKQYTNLFLCSFC